ncbi:N-acetylglucosamine-6-phosphate deacetylase [Anaerosporobacter sp.]|uniref:N-acetylglucosamine-6-phosphate deacetylase n=1 Tax=Anaerosporobacter sp. TaxID=1872529 RepID=UPI00286F30B7|nr:N-acetylglucosamine-6-phosphate deacetylase [Anaerosporobacter sp.]
MIIKNGILYSEQNTFISADIITENDLIQQLVLNNDDITDSTVNMHQVIDATDCYIIPGLTDLHFHGCVGYDACDSSMEAMEAITTYELSHGITTISPATMTLPEEDLHAILDTMHNYKLAHSDESHADIIGVYLEGPFLSESKKGAQDATYIRKPDAGFYKRLQTAAHGLIRFVAVAPEEENAIELIKECHDEVGFTIAHTDSDYENAMRAFKAGAKQVTHLYNAMPSLHHRSPGVIGAAFDSKHSRVEIIADGNHIHPSVVRLTFQLFGDDRVILISDSMSATGMPDGKYSLGGQDVYVENSIAKLEDQVTIAGSTTNLYDCMCRAIKMGIPFESAIKAACENPIKALGLYDNYGSITPNKKANLLILNKDLQIQHIIKDGKLFK